MGVLQDNLVLSTELIMWISHRKEIRKLTFRAQAFRRSESSDSLRRRASARNVSFRISLRWLIYIINSVDKTKLSWFTSLCVVRRKTINQRKGLKTLQWTTTLSALRQNSECGVVNVRTTADCNQLFSFCAWPEQEMCFRYAVVVAPVVVLN